MFRLEQCRQPRLNPWTEFFWSGSFILLEPRTCASLGQGESHFRFRFSRRLGEHDRCLVISAFEDLVVFVFIAAHVRSP